MDQYNMLFIFPLRLISALIQTKQLDGQGHRLGLEWAFTPQQTNSTKSHIKHSAKLSWPSSIIRMCCFINSPDLFPYSMKFLCSSFTQRSVDIIQLFLFRRSTLVTLSVALSSIHKRCKSPNSTIRYYFLSLNDICTQSQRSNQT